MKKTLGGDRLGAGKKMTVEMHNYERSTHDLGYLWRSTMSVGTLVPFIKEVALPGDTFDIDLNTVVMTHPTVGPLFGSMKVQLDVFQAPIRLYQGALHNNKLGIGMNMAAVKLPVMTLYTNATGYDDFRPEDIDNAQINPSALLAYLDIRGVAASYGAVGRVGRDFNAVPLLAYWEIYKNYYANKQEEIGAMIWTEPVAVIQTVDSITISGNTVGAAPINITSPETMIINYTGTRPNLNTIILETSQGEYNINQIADIISEGGGVITLRWRWTVTGNIDVTDWRYQGSEEITTGTIHVQTFDLSTIDDMRESILSEAANPAPFNVLDNAQAGSPYENILRWGGTFEVSPYMASQQGLALKTYNSDLFNNWLSTEWIDGTGGINDITKVDTSGGFFTIDTLQLHKKIYDMLNRIAVSGGSYDDWLDAVWTHDRLQKAESPIYHGGLIKELVFQEVISNSESPSSNGSIQPLGTLAGRGTLSQKHKGGHVTIKVDEPSYIIGIVSITPRLDYSQGNKWDVTLQTMDDLHKPALDEIGFQELIEEQMAWWSTVAAVGPVYQQKSAGKQPAWINYMTNVNVVRGNFAIPNNEMFMVLNRKYEYDPADAITGIVDMTTYIDPEKFNHIFAQTSLDAQNYWVQIAVDMTARRKMSAKLMPNL